MAVRRTCSRSAIGTLLAPERVLLCRAIPMDQPSPSHSYSVHSDDAIIDAAVGARMWRFSAHTSTKHCLRVAAIRTPPWVEAREDCLHGIEIEALERYCGWRDCAAEVTLHASADIPALLRHGHVDLAMGGLADTSLLAAMARLVTFSPRPLMFRTEQAARSRHHRHVWAVARCCGAEVLHLRFFLRALRYRRRR